MGLAGKTDVEAAWVDMIGDALKDLGTHVRKIYRTKDETQKAELQAGFKNEILPVAVDKLENLLVSNGGGDGFFVGDGLTWVDIHFACQIDYVPRIAGFNVPWDKVPKLKALKERVEAVPKIAAWIKNRPQTRRS